MKTSSTHQLSIWEMAPTTLQTTRYFAAENVTTISRRPSRGLKRERLSLSPAVS